MRDWNMSLDMYDESLLIGGASIPAERTGRLRLENLPFASLRISQQSITKTSQSNVGTVDHEMSINFEGQHQQSRLSKVLEKAKKRRRETSDDLVVDPIKRQRPVPSQDHALSDPELPCYRRRVHNYNCVPEDAILMDMTVETATMSPISFESREEDERLFQAGVDETMEIDESYPVHQLEPEKPPLRPMTRHVKNSLVTIPIISPTKVLRSPFMGPVGWTVPPKMSAQKSKPFLIYQDPETFDPTRAFPSSRPNLNAYVSDDNKENELIHSDAMSAPLDSIEGDGDDAVIAPDNTTTGAANISSLAEAFHPENLHRSQSQGYLMQIDDDKSDVDTPNTSSNMALTRRRQRTDPVMAVAAHSRYF